MKSFIVLSLIALFGLVNCQLGDDFEIRVRLMDKEFEPINGTLKLIVNNQILTLNEGILRPDVRYDSEHSLDTKYEDLGKDTDVRFYWTTSHKSDDLTKSPKIHLEKVYIALMNVRCACVRFYCPDEGQEIIKPDQHIQLKYCGGFD